LDPETFVRTNVLGTLTLLNAAKAAWGEGGEGRFIQVSTDEVYGSLGEEGLFTEETPLDAHSPYSASKAGADMLGKSYFDTYKMPVIITRCSNNYGPYQFPEKLIPLMINNALSGKPLPVYGAGLNVRDWLYVKDHARAIDMVTEGGRPGEVYNIGGHNEMTNIDIVKIIINTLQKLLPPDDPRRGRISEELITFVADRKGHDFRYAIDPGKITAELGWRPETMFSQGIELAVKWYLDNAEWLESITSGEYESYYERVYGERVYGL
jgi:dTDP-glucose 4,6-dehydratase